MYQGSIRDQRRWVRSGYDMYAGILVLVLALGVFLPIWDLGRVAFKK